MNIKDVLTWGAVIFGSAAALLWFYASIVKVPPKSDEGDWAEARILNIEGDKVTDVLATVQRQSFWNAWAAIAASLAALCQAISLLL